jgi:hypothetical protein
MGEFVVALGRPVRHVHVAEDGWSGDPDILGLTLCGLPMSRHELWTAVERHRGDRLCFMCADEAGLVETVKPGIEAFAVIPRHK